MASIFAALFLCLWIGMSCFVAFWWDSFKYVIDSTVGRILMAPVIGLLFSLGAAMVITIFILLVGVVINGKDLFCIWQ